MKRAFTLAALMILMVGVAVVGLMPAVAMGGDAPATSPAASPAAAEQGIGSALWAFVNSPVGIAIVGSLVAWLLARLYTTKPTWKTYEGYIVEAVKFAEKSIPDDVENKGLRRADEALKYISGIFSQINSRPPTAKEAKSLEQGINLVHERLEANGNLDKSAALSLDDTRILPPAK